MSSFTFFQISGDQAQLNLIFILLTYYDLFFQKLDVMKLLDEIKMQKDYMARHAFGKLAYEKAYCLVLATRSEATSMNWQMEKLCEGIRVGTTL